MIFYILKIKRKLEWDKRDLGNGFEERVWMFCYLSFRILEIFVEEV